MSINPWVRRWEVESKTEVGKMYTVGQRRDGSFGCSCPAWKFHEAPKPHCKHIRSITQEVLPPMASSQTFADTLLPKKRPAEAVVIEKRSVVTAEFVVTEISLLERPKRRFRLEE